MNFCPIADFLQLPVYTPDTAPTSAPTPIALLTRDRQSEAVLEQLALTLGSRLVLPEVWRDLFPQTGVLISSAISGGSLQARFREAAEQSPGRCWLLLEPMQTVFPLPCPTGQGSPAPMEHGNVFYSDTLCCQYTHFLRNGTGYMLLWDTEETLQQKCMLAKDCGFLGCTVHP